MFEISLIEPYGNEFFGKVEADNWIRAPCNHYVHKECLRDNIDVIDKC
jgi:hypothetical protein